MTAMTSQAAFAAKRPEVRERSVVPVGQDLLDDRVAAVVLLGLNELRRGAGEDRTVAPGGEQLVLAGNRLRVQVAAPADDETGGDLQILLLKARAA